MKRLMLLGGTRFLLPLIDIAHRLGLYVITADYLPDNIAHKHSDAYLNLSIIDKEAVLEAARAERIDGIMSFGVDPGVVTAAYVAEQMGLPFQCSYAAACILQDKARFRQFLAGNGFNCPTAKGYTSESDALNDADTFPGPVIVKPVDTAGSKGITAVRSKEYLTEAVRTAFDNSLSKRIIIEDFLDTVGFQSSTDIFTVEGMVDTPVFSDQMFDPSATNPYVPTLEIWPTTMPSRYQSDLTDQLNRLFRLLHCRNGIYNVECRVCSDGKAYLMEVSPRGGGNHIALLQDMALGTNYIENEIRNAVGIPLQLNRPQDIKGVWCTYSIHPHDGQSGTLRSIRFSPNIQDRLRFTDLSYTPGATIQPFTGANMSLGDVLLQFDTRSALIETVSDPSRWIDINTD